MRELIQVTERQVGNAVVQGVNARELHAFLGCKNYFREWIKDRINQYDFVEGEDFMVVHERGATHDGISREIPRKSKGLAQKSLDPQDRTPASNRGRSRKEYIITIDMAKELAMVEGNAKGKEARRYFIECERRANSPKEQIKTILKTPALVQETILELLEMNRAIQSQNDELIETVDELETTIEVQAPKVEFHDKVADAVNCHTFDEAGKIFGIGRNRFFKLLRDEGYLKWGNMPYQKWLEKGLFRVRERPYVDSQGNSRIHPQPLVTGKGMIYFHKYFPGKQQGLLTFSQ